MNLAVTGHEDASIRIFDLNQAKCINAISQAHDDAISGIAFTSSGQHLLSIAHDGKLKLWDIRTYRCIDTQ